MKRVDEADFLFCEKSILGPRKFCQRFPESCIGEEALINRIACPVFRPRRRRRILSLRGCSGQLFNIIVPGSRSGTGGDFLGAADFLCHPLDALDKNDIVKDDCDKKNDSYRNLFQCAADSPVIAHGCFPLILSVRVRIFPADGLRIYLQLLFALIVEAKDMLLVVKILC